MPTQTRIVLDNLSGHNTKTRAVVSGPESLRALRFTPTYIFFLTNQVELCFAKIERAVVAGRDVISIRPTGGSADISAAAQRMHASFGGSSPEAPDAFALTNFPRRGHQMTHPWT